MIQTITYTGKKLLPLYPASPNAPRHTFKLATGTYVYGQVVKESGTPGTYAALANGADTGGVMVVGEDCVVDADGIHWPGQQASAENGSGELHTSGYSPGGNLSFDTRDLCIDNARTVITGVQITSLNATLVSGTAAAGIIQL